MARLLADKSHNNEMIFEKYIPSFPLSLYIQHFIYAKGEHRLPYLMELPEGKVNLVVELEENSVDTIYTGESLGKKRIMKKAWLSGTQPQAIVYAQNNHSAILSIRFTLDGFFALTKIPVTEIIHPGLEAELVLDNSFAELYQKLLNEESIGAKFQIVEQYFLKYIKEVTSETLLSSFLNKNIEKPVDWLVSKSGYSQKHLIHTIKKQTGFSPKYLQRLHRFQKVINFIQLHKIVKEINWASVAYEYGYYDQAHFIKEFTHFTGFSPKEYFYVNNLDKQNYIFTDIKILQQLKR